MPRLFGILWKGMPDMKWKVEDVIAEGDRVVARVTMTGTQTGPLEFKNGPSPATGREVITEHVNVFRIAGGKVAEHWQGRDDIGMFRQLKDGKPEFYEFMTLSEEGGTVVLRIKHFTPPNLVGWEDKDKAETFRYVGKKDGAILFEGLTYQPDGDRGAIIYVATKKGEELQFKLTRSR